MPLRFERIFFIILLIIGLLTANGWFAFYNIRRLYQEAGLVAHTYQTIGTVQNISWVLTEAESAQRGYLLTGEPRFLELYRMAAPAINDHLAELSRLTADNPFQNERIAVFKNSINKRLKILHDNLSLRTPKGFASARAAGYLTRGKAEMDAVRGQIREFIDEEKQLLGQRSQNASNAFNIALLTSLLANFICLAAILGLIFAVRRHLAAREKAAAVLFEQREQFRITLASIGEGVITTDPGGRVTYLNAVAQSLTGWSSREASGQPLEKVFNIVNEDTRVPVENPVTRVLNYGRTVELPNQAVLIAKDGMQKPIEDSAAPIKDEDDHIRGVVLIFKDVTEVRRSQNELHQSALRYRHLAEELSKSNRELEQFAYVASHDLQEPLHVVNSFVDLLSMRGGEKLEPREKEYLGFIKQAGNQAKTLVRELLEYSRIGKATQAQLVDINAVLEEVKFSLRFAIEESKAEIIVAEKLPDIEAMHGEIMQLFQNLLSNAIRYRTPNVQPRIQISWSKLNNMYLFSVKDNGIGIEPQYKERIFEMFQRLQARTDSSGTGIGLALCKKIVEQHGGKIWVESQPGKGSIFYFTLKAS